VTQAILIEGLTAKGFARFHVDFEAEGGMSGGPVFAKRNKRLLGLVSSNLQGTCHSTVCALWPILLEELPSGKTLQSLHRAGQLNIRDVECVTQDGDKLIYRGSDIRIPTVREVLLEPEKSKLWLPPGQNDR
jgi:hypothetical protein